MYGAFPKLRNSRIFEEQIGERETGFNVIIWGRQATKEMKVEVT